MKKVSTLFWKLIFILILFFVLALYRISLINTNTVPRNPYNTPTSTIVHEDGLSTDASPLTPLVEAASVDITLGMKTWNWVSTMDSTQKELKPRASKDFAITFKNDKTFFITTDCNSITGVYATNGQNISLKIVLSTQLYCEDAQEELFVRTVANATEYSFTSQKELVLNLKSGGSMTLQ